MKTLYLDCGMGAAGDMLTAALVELMPDLDQFITKLNDLSIPGVEVKKESAVKCGIRGTHISVMVQGMEESEEMYVHDHGYQHSYEHYHDHGENLNHEHHDHGQEENHNSYGHHDHGQEGNHSHEHHNHDTHHHHSGMHEIEHIISELKLPSKVQQDILAVYHLIAEAERVMSMVCR